jgi:hypothetical protein
MERGRGGGLSRWMEDDWCIRWGTSDSGTLLCRRELYICKPIPQRKKGGASEIVTIGVINGYVIRFFFSHPREIFFCCCSRLFSFRIGTQKMVDINFFLCFVKYY